MPPMAGWWRWTSTAHADRCRRDLDPLKWSDYARRADSQRPTGARAVKESFHAELRSAAIESEPCIGRSLSGRCRLPAADNGTGVLFLGLRTTSAAKSTRSAKIDLTIVEEAEDVPGRPAGT